MIRRRYHKIDEVGKALITLMICMFVIKNLVCIIAIDTHTLRIQHQNNAKKDYNDAVDPLKLLRKIIEVDSYKNK